MAMNLEAVLRIAAKVVGLDEVSKLERGIAGAEKAASSAQNAFKAVASSATWQAAAVAAGAFAVGIGLAARAAIDFESSMADVRKVVSGLETPKAFSEIKTEILELSRQMPITARGFAEIYAAAGQSGIARDQLKNFATLVAQVGIAFDMTAQDAGRSLSQLKVSLGLSTPEVRNLADAMNYVSNNTGATAANLVEFMSRAGAVGKLAGLSGQQTMAFGAAMIQTGIQSEVAATSFNNMIKALSRGPSMTERQVSALRRLGYSMVDAVKAEQELTRAAERESRQRVDAARQQSNEVVRIAEEQSRRRLEVARNETDQLSKEINRRYRNEQQALQDHWDDQAAIREDGLQDAAAEQIKHLQRMQQAEIKAAQDQAKASGASADAYVDAIRDRYDRLIDLVRDRTERQITLERRAARDQQQVVRDSLQDRQDAELKAQQERYRQIESTERQFVEGQKRAAEGRYQEIESAERAFVDRAKAEAKKTGEALALASSQGFADRLQENAIGTIMEVLGKIRDLPKSQQVSVLSDLFGDEARGLAPLLANLGELERILGLAGDKGAYNNSVLEEFTIRSETAANKLQLFNNNMTALQITTGEKLLPALVKILEYLTPMVEAFAGLASANPVLTTVALAVAGIGSALILAAPGVLALVTLFGQLGVVLTPIPATIAGWAGAIGPAIVAIKGALLGLVGWLSSTLLPGLLAFFSGPVGWTVLAVAAVVAAAIAFREPLMQFVSWLWTWGEPIREFWIGLWNGLVELVRFSIETVGSILQFGLKASMAALSGDWSKLWTMLRKPVTDLWKFVTDRATAKAKELQGIWQAISKAFVQYVADPVTKAWTTVVEFIPKAMDTARQALVSAFESAANAVRGVFGSILQWIAGQVIYLVGMVNTLISGFNNVSAAVGGPQLSMVPTMSVPAFAEGGIVNRPTLAMVGEGGEREYIVPESKMAVASSRFLSGSRGADVIPTSSSSTPTAGPAPTINVTTGPVLEFDGRRYVTVDDYHRGLRQVADGVFARLRTPASRRALGVT